MKVGINGLLLSGHAGYRQTGVSRYVSRLAAALPEAMPDDDLLVYTGRGVEVPNARRAPVDLERPEIRVLWERAMVPLLAQRDRLDLFHGTVNTLPRGLRCRSVVTVHDLAFLRWPEQVPRKRYRYLSRAVPAAVSAAHRVIAVSAATKFDVVDLLGVDPAKVAVVPLGVEERFQPAPASEVTQHRVNKRLNRPFLLTVGTLEPRKNLPRLLEAFATVQHEIPHDLVLVGPEGWLTGSMHERIAALRLGDRLKLTGYVPDDELPVWYSAADALVVPSVYEGFGLPALEAMACGCPVIVSDRSALPEVTGNAAELVDPDSVESIAAGLRRVAIDPGRRRHLAAAGVGRAAGFTWRRTAELTAAVYREAIE